MNPPIDLIVLVGFGLHFVFSVAPCVRVLQIGRAQSVVAAWAYLSPISVDRDDGVVVGGLGLFVRLLVWDAKLHSFPGRLMYGWAVVVPRLLGLALRILAESVSFNALVVFMAVGLCSALAFVLRIRSASFLVALGGLVVDPHFRHL